jgi:hypothetical protein
MPLPQVTARFREIAARQLQSQQGGCAMSITEHLDGLACAEVVARQMRDQALVYDALRAGATWAELADATGADADQVRGIFMRWLRGQRALYLERGPGWGISAHEYADGLRAATAAEGRCSA